jgi:hypothetical protein
MNRKGIGSALPIHETAENSIGKDVDIAGKKLALEVARVRYRVRHPI